MAEPTVTNNPAANQFELSTGSKLAFLQYKLRPGRIVFLHTEVPKELEGHGIGGKLARAGLEFARKQGLAWCRCAPLSPTISSGTRSLSIWLLKNTARG
jgi:predicted GNAT family acetyltransferase